MPLIDLTSEGEKDLMEKYRCPKCGSNVIFPYKKHRLENRKKYERIEKNIKEYGCATCGHFFNKPKRL